MPPLGLGQEAWQCVAQWVWNVRLELGHQLEPTPIRTTEFALPVAEATVDQAPVQGYGTPAIALYWKAGRFSGEDFTLQPDGKLRCPANQSLTAHEQRREADGSLRVVYPTGCATSLTHHSSRKRLIIV